MADTTHNSNSHTPHTCHAARELMAALVGIPGMLLCMAWLVVWLIAGGDE